MSTLYRIDHLQEALSKNWPILTPNRRLASKISQAWAQKQRGKVVAKPNVSSLEDWLTQLSTELTPLLPLLTPTQQQLAWEYVVSRLDHGLLTPDKAIARLLSSADDLLCLWQTPAQQLPSDPDSQLLKRACADFEHLLNELNVTTLYRSVSGIQQRGGWHIANANKKIILTGFDTLPPLFSNVLASFANPAETINSPGLDGKSQQVALQDPETELYAAAQWAKQTLMQAPDINETRIGILIPDLPIRRAQVERVFQTVFEPQYILPGIARHSAPFNISAGENLAQQPIITCALELLALDLNEQPLHSLLYLLNSPFWSRAESELQERIQLEKIFRSFQQEHVSVYSATTKLLPDHFVSTLWHKAIQSVPHKNKAPSRWINDIQNKLGIFGWPGERKLDSVEYQQAQHFQQAIDQLILADDFYHEITFNQAIQLLKGFCQQSVFQAETKDSPIQILGLLEGSALHFDSCWVCGMSSNSWPPAPNPHPLLPIALQIKKEMPHCSKEREAIFCKKISHDLLNNSSNIIISFAETVDDTPQSISHFFSDLKKTSINKILNTSLSLKTTYVSLIADRADIEILIDEHGPAFTKTSVKGGIGLLKEQAENPFDAFAKYRLLAEPLEEPEIGLPKKIRGNLIHHSLYHFWGNLSRDGSNNLEGLKGLSSASLQGLIEKSVFYALKQENHPLLKNRSFANLEKKRLTRQLLIWLETEKQRLPFQILELEKRIHHTLSGIAINLTIDRIDQLINSNGSIDGTLLIDYKTAKMLNSNDWLNHPPTEPQLPLYCLTHPESLGIAYGQINAHKIDFISIGAHPNIPNLKKNGSLNASQWEQLKKSWQQDLDNLMKDFKQGLATVTYRNANSIAEHRKPYQALNRWLEKNYMDQLLEDTKS